MERIAHGKIEVDKGDDVETTGVSERKARGENDVVVPSPGAVTLEEQSTYLAVVITPY